MTSSAVTHRLALFAIGLGAALLAEAAILYYLDDPTIRLGAGLALLAAIVWLSAKVGVVSRIQQTLVRGFKRRRYLELRRLVDRFLADVRRLNWLAAGAERGFQTRSVADREIDTIEKRLHGLIKEIREAAGQASPEGGVDDRAAA